MVLRRAPGGNTAWTWGRIEEERTAPSAPTRAVSWRHRVIRAKYWGRSEVRMRTTRFLTNSSALSNSAAHPLAG